MSMSLSGAFRHYNASLKNPQWACSAEAADGSIVLTCWAHMLKSANRKLTYRDNTSQWLNNRNGRNLLNKHLQLAMDGDRPIKMVLVRIEDAEAVDRGEATRNIPKTFWVRNDVIGRLMSFDGMCFEIEFEPKARVAAN